ncbi:MAG: hypothetical protein IT562_14820 [Alphaproteobacteria bacterium]|nr:hypothetical protein [Alphaproteobacteria bacterium]
MPETVSLNMRQFLAWIEGGERSYAEAMEAWRTSCPRLSEWEDALGQGLIRMDNAGVPRAVQSRVVLTPLGRAALNGDARGRN